MSKHKIDLEWLSTEECVHTCTEIVDGSEVCVECGICTETLTFDKEWRYYGSLDNKNSKDPSRCHKRKKDQRTIHKDVEKYNIPEAIVESSNVKYQVIVKDQIYRGDRRLSIIVACLFYAYMEHGVPRTAERIGKIFKLSKKKVSEGISIYHTFFPDSLDIYLTPHDLLRGIMIDVGINMSHFRRINNLCVYLQNKSSILNRSSPQSVAAAIVYLHLCLLPQYKESVGLTKIKFSKLVGLSDITIGRLAKNAAEMIDCDVKI